MSAGIGGWARLIHEDERVLEYEYGCFDDKYRNPERLTGGRWRIYKDRLPAADFCDRVSELLESGAVEIENSVNCHFVTDKGYGATALRMLFKLFRLRGENGRFPEKIDYYC